MPDARAVATIVTFAYGACLTGAGAAWLLSTVLRAGQRKLSAPEATLCAVLPLMALIVLAFTAALAPVDREMPFPLHHAWHAWVDMLHTAPRMHTAFHWVQLLMVLCAAARLGCLVQAGVRMFVQSAQVRTLPAQHLLRSAVSVFVLDTDRLLCFVLGIHRPRIYVSARLLEVLPEREKDAMLAHEAAHIRRRDGLWNALFLAFYHLFPLPRGWDLYREWQKATERACDAHAAHTVGSPLDVASALIEVARIVNRQTVQGPVHFTNGEDVEGRVQALLDMPSHSRPPKTYRIVLGTVVSLTVCVLSKTLIRHLVELFVNH